MKRSLADEVILRHGIGHRISELPAFKELVKQRKPLLRIVLVDDDYVFCALINHWASKFRVAVDVCTTGAELKKRLERGPTDAIIMDQFLVDEQGLDLANSLLSVPVIMTSGTVRVSEWKNLPQNVFAVVHKKFGIPTILNTAVSVVANHGGPEKQKKLFSESG